MTVYVKCVVQFNVHKTLQCLFQELSSKYIKCIRNSIGIPSRKYLHTHYLLIKGCKVPNWHADGYCDDENNNEACFYDGGDCCGPNVNTEWCTVCQCLE